MKRRGYSILELTLLLALAALLLGLAWPGARAARDAYAVRAARTETVDALARTRALAIARGGAALSALADSALLHVVDAADSVHVRVDLRPLGVELDGGAGVDSFRVVYDGLGLGRVASRSIRLTRGRAEARITVSAYGRVRAW